MAESDPNRNRSQQHEEDLDKVVVDSIQKSVSTVDQVGQNCKDNMTKNGLKKRERRHIYHDIAPLKIECSSSQSHVNGHGENDRLVSRLPLVKPEIPPKPKYILRDKMSRHVYQSINLSSVDKMDSVPPPLPFKPPRLQRLKDSKVDSPPPLPPRILNQQGIIQRQRLDQEYFENLRKSVDDGLLGLAEEHDLPVPLNLPLSNNMQPLRFEYGAHSPPLNVSNANEARANAAPRRHSLPLQEHVDNDLHYNGEAYSSLPARDNSHTHDSQTMAQLSHSQTNLANNFVLLKRCGWYWGNMSWQEAEALLAKREGNGAFLVRDSQDPRHLLTITVRSTTNTLHHIRVEYCEGKFQLYEPGGSVSQSAAQCVRHSNIQQFINLAVKHSMSGSFLYFLKPRNMGEPPVQIQLLTPISRLSKVKSLKYICRMMIRNAVVPDLIATLPVPARMRRYLREGPYYDASEE